MSETLGGVLIPASEVRAMRRKLGADRDRWHHAARVWRLIADELAEALRNVPYAALARCRQATGAEQLEDDS